MSEKESIVEPENYLLNLMIGLQIMSKVGASNLSAANGVIFCGDCVDTNEEEELLSKLGWEYDEDNGEFYYLVYKAEQKKTCVNCGTIATEYNCCKICAEGAGWYPDEK